MPKAQRSPEEIQLVRDDIMSKALELITSDGYDGFSMRKLATRLGIAAKTIYNYFQNQDELYLCLLTKGFEQLYECYEIAVGRHKKPMNQIGAVIAAYIEFGLENPNIYNLMFTWHVPKFNDYKGTPMENVARHELNTALKCFNFAIDLMRDYLGDSPAIKEDTLQVELIQIWSHMHGYVAGINNTLLDYLHENPLSLKQMVIDRAFRNVRSDLTAYQRRIGLTVILD
ncbi:TetR/AcrR family transcriptional regulator [bacterium]|nr:TetR/AcrR family transcriptional regulator [bacterium]